MGNLALVFNDIGEYEKAEKLYNDVLFAYEKTVGVSHPDTLLTVNNLGSLYHKLGDYDKAEKFLQTKH